MRKEHMATNGKAGLERTRSKLHKGLITTAEA